MQQPATNSCNCVFPFSADIIDFQYFNLLFANKGKTEEEEREKKNCYENQSDLALFAVSNALLWTFRATAKGAKFTFRQCCCSYFRRGPRRLIYWCVIVRTWFMRSLIDFDVCKASETIVHFGFTIHVCSMKWGECINEGLTAQQFRLSAIKVNGYQLRRSGWLYKLMESNEICDLRENNESHRFAWSVLDRRTFHFAHAATRWTRWTRYISHFASDLHVQNWRRWNNGIENNKGKVNNVVDVAVVVCLAWLHARFLFTRETLLSDQF